MLRVFAGCLGSGSEPVEPLDFGDNFDTGPDTPCVSDSDCWCRSFDGANFYEEKVPSYCNLTVNRCRICYYE